MCSPELPALVRVFAKTLDQSKQPAALNRAAHAALAGSAFGYTARHKHQQNKQHPAH